MFKKLILGFSMLVAAISFINPIKSEACGGRRGYYGGGYSRPYYSGYGYGNRGYGYRRSSYYGGGYGGYRGRYW